MVNIHQNYAEIVIAIKTQIAGRKVLNDAYNELINIKDIMLDEQDYNMLEKNLNKLIKYLYSTSVSIPIKLKHPEITLCAKWADRFIYRYLQQYIQFKEYPPGTVLCELNTYSLGVYIISSGLVKVKGIPKKEKENLEILQNSDSHMYFTSNEPFEDYKTVAESLGLFGLLTRRKLATTAICETKVENYTSDNLMNLLQDAAMPDFRDFNEFTRPEFVLDIVLIQGKIIDKFNNEEYYGPIYIPRDVIHFIFTPKEIRFSRLVTLFLAPIHKKLNMQLDWMQKLENKLMKSEKQDLFGMKLKNIEISDSIKETKKEEEEEEEELTDIMNYYDKFSKVLLNCPTAKSLKKEK